MAKHSVKLLGPSFLIYGDETGLSSATAVFTQPTHPPVTEEVPLSNKTFTEVGGDQIGGPELVSILILRGELLITVFPEQDLLAGPFAWGVLQPPPPDSGPVYKLQITVDGKEEVVPFSTQRIPPPLRNTLLVDGAIYNNLERAQLSVTYDVPGIGGKDTPFVGRGQNTGGVFTAEILWFNVLFIGTEPDKWTTENLVTTTKGLPILVSGDGAAPILLVFREFGPVEQVKLIPSQV